MEDGRRISPIKNGLFIILLVFYFYNTKLNFLPVSSFVWAPILFLILMFFCFFNYGFYINKEFESIAVSWFFLTVLFLFSALANSYKLELSMLRLPFVFLIASVVVPFVIIRFYNNNVSVIYKNFGLVAFINSIFIIGMFIFPPFKVFWHSVVESTIERLYGEISLTNSMMSLRMVGINGFSAYSTAAIQIFLSFFYMLHVFYNNYKPKIRDNLVLSFILLSSFLVARTSFVLLPFFIILYIYLFNLRCFLNLLLLVVAVLFFSGFFALVFVSEDFLLFFFDWSLSLFDSGLKTGSLQKNISMFSSFSLNDFSLLGDFNLRSESGGYYKETDVGYYRLFFAIGILGALVFMFFLFSPLFFSFNKLSVFSSPPLFVGLLFSIMIFVLLLKGLFVFDSFPVLTMISIIGISSKYLNVRLNCC
ncbi:hypothetical protein HNR62_000760 [Oceanisphaera litoralis]|uniref:hypothetical protein n=1 Tax=Oceanisphaera litoralis TaxID=225144 RepID=UPI00195C3B09|nr:hypothetical protein [Oceanisphaera litoralis]MBM7454925.1 hypothetical protein [Oceanisphaera litoralis]